MIKNLFVVVLLVSVLIVNAEEETQFATITNGRTAYVSQCSDSIQLKPFTIVTSPCPASTSSTVSKVGSTSGTGFGKGFYIGFLSKDPWKDMTEAVAMTCLNAAKGIAYKWIDEIGERIVYKAKEKCDLSREKERKKRRLLGSAGANHVKNINNEPPTRKKSSRALLGSGMGSGIGSGVWNFPVPTHKVCGHFNAKAWTGSTPCTKKPDGTNCCQCNTPFAKGKVSAAGTCSCSGCGTCKTEPESQTGTSSSVGC